jgi:hypothetical protein
MTVETVLVVLSNWIDAHPVSKEGVVAESDIAI